MVTKTCAAYSVRVGDTIKFAGYTIQVKTANPIVATFYLTPPGSDKTYGIQGRLGYPPYTEIVDRILVISIALDSITVNDTGQPYIVSFTACTETDVSAEPTPELPPEPTPGEQGPQIVECLFPELSLNFISVMSGLASWLGCMIRNLITLIQWIVDWALHFSDHLDAWISRLFGVDPSLPFFDEVLKKIDIWISGKFGVDPALPFWDELVKKALTWIGLSLDTAAENRIRDRKW